MNLFVCKLAKSIIKQSKVVKDTGLDEFNAIIRECIGANFNDDDYLIETWTSMQSLIIVSAIDQHYNVLITHEELKSSITTIDLFKSIKLKKA